MQRVKQELRKTSAKTEVNCLIPFLDGNFQLELNAIGHRPVIVKRAVIGSKGGWKLSRIFSSCKLFHKWSIIKLENILYLLDGYIFAELFEATSHCFC